MEDKISVIIPVYNVEKYIEKTVNSVLSQTYQNIEIVIVDDGSTDNTAYIIDECAKKDGRIKVIHKQNGGVTSARLCGAENATGDYIGFCDGDDILEPDMYEVLLINAKKYNADISHCGYKMVFPSRTDMYYGTEKIVLQNDKDGVKDLISGDFIEPCLCNKLYKKELVINLLQNGLLDVSVDYFEDLLMNYYLFKQSTKSVFYDKCFYNYMVRAGSAATGTVNEKKLTDPLKVFKIIFEDVKENSELQAIINKRVLTSLINIATVKKDKNLVAVRKNARKELKQKQSDLKKFNYSEKFRLQVRFAANCPNLYAVVHRLYSTVTGSKNKYKVD